MGIQERLRRLGQRILVVTGRVEVWLVVMQALMAAVTGWMAYETRQVATETMKSVSLVGLQLREDRPVIKGEFIAKIENLCTSTVRLVNTGKRTATNLKWRLVASLLDIRNSKPKQLEVTNGHVTEIAIYTGPADAVVLAGFDLSLLKELRLTHRVYSLQFSVEKMEEPILYADPRLPSLPKEAFCRE